MAFNKRDPFKAGVMFLCLAVVVLLAMLSNGVVVPSRTNLDGPLSGQVQSTSTATPIDAFDYTMVLSSTEAISRSLQLFPPGHATTVAPVAMLMPYSQVDNWRKASSPGLASTDPAWVVGIMGQSLTVDDVLAGEVPKDISPSISPAPAAGAFYIWDARTGMLTGIGVLQAQGSRTWASLNSLQHVPMTIEAATRLPPYPTNTPITPGVPTESRP